MEDFDYKSFQARALKQLKAGKPFSGKDGALYPVCHGRIVKAG